MRNSRGTICKLCDRKFFIKNIVRTSSKEIATQNIAIKAIKKNLDMLCDDAQREIDDDELAKDRVNNVLS